MVNAIRRNDENFSTFLSKRIIIKYEFFILPYFG